ncbi:MAG: hypothetical protein HQ534_06805 [Armatimonadetes bacterium]|nr:hypothetical protein [Armatimonadota bacterium]
MQFIKTKDSSFTVYNERYKEHYHTLSGALEEAFEKHVNAIGVEDESHILDFCFGLGYNSIAATKGHKNLNILGLENDLEIIKAIKNLTVPKEIEKEFSAFRNLTEKPEITDENNNTIKLILGDAIHTIDQLPEVFFNRVFFDPFSPKKQPEMWSKEVFKKVFALMKPGAKLSTYSCAKMVRENMKAAGFIVMDGPIIGRKSPATIAIKSHLASRNQQLAPRKMCNYSS